MKDARSRSDSQGFLGGPERLDAVIGHPETPFIETGAADKGALLFSAPHAGRFYPPELLDRAKVSVARLRRLEDPLTDILISRATAAGVTGIAGAYARAWIDLNRRETEVDARQITPPPPAHSDHRSPRVSAGFGLIPRTTGDGRHIYDRLLPLEAVATRIREVHRPYHARIAALLAEKKACHGIALLCDMHSMPPLPAGQASDVVIGDRHGQTCAAWLTAAVQEWLTGKGLRVTRNLPYAGGHGVERHGNPANGIHAMQLEFDRRLYLNDDGLTPNAEADALTVVIAEMAAMLSHLVEEAGGFNLAAE